MSQGNFLKNAAMIIVLLTGVALMVFTNTVFVQIVGFILLAVGIIGLTFKRRQAKTYNNTGVLQIIFIYICIQACVLFFGGAPFKTRNKAINYNLLLKKSFEKIGRENYEDNLHVFYAGI